HRGTASSGSITSHKEDKVHDGNTHADFPVATVSDRRLKMRTSNLGAQRAPLQNTARTEKNREENKFSSRVEVRVVTPKKIRAVNPALGLVPFFLRCFFLCCFFLCHRLIPPFQSATRGAVVKSWE